MKRWTVTFIVGFILGVLAESLVNFGWPFAALFFVLAAGFLFLRLVKPAPIFLFALVLSLGLGLGVWRASLALSGGGDLSVSENQTVTLTGVVSAEPDDRENTANLSVKLDNSPAKVLLTLPRHHGFKYGDRLRFTGRLVRPKNFLTGAGKEFDYVSYLKKDDIFYQMFEPQVERLESDKGFRLQARLFDLKQAWLERLGRLLPEPEASLAGGLVVGARQGLGEKWQTIFRRASLTHVVVLSGYNVSVIADNVNKFLSFFLPRGMSLSFGALGVVLLVLISGAGPSAVRAGLMALVALLGRVSGRIYQASWALLVVVFLMVLFNPKILVWDLGFQLSVLATAGLIYFAPFFERWLRFLPTFLNIRSIAATTLAAQTAVLPWLLYKMGEWSLVALPANVLVLLFIPLTMFFVFLAGAFGLVSLVLAKPASWLAYAFLVYELKVAELFASLPFASRTIQSFPFILVIAIYAGYIWFACRRPLSSPKIKL